MIEKLISGGETGAERAALDWALANKIPHGGYCPKGKRAEDGIIPDKYWLEQLPSTNRLVGTARNVVESDASVIISIRPLLYAGSKGTATFARKHRKPLLRLHGNSAEAGKQLAVFVQRHNIRVLNVTGPRGSTEPNVCAYVIEVLDAALKADCYQRSRE